MQPGRGTASVEDDYYSDGAFKTVVRRIRNRSVET